MKPTTEPKVIGVSIGHSFDHPSEVEAWVKSGSLKIWLRDGKEFLSAPLYVLPAAGGSFRKLFPIGIDALGRWESPKGTVIYLELDNGSILEICQSTGVF